MSATAPHDVERRGLWGHVDLELLIYGTTVLMTVLVVALDDGIDDFVEGAQLVIGPLIATFAAHLFASVLSRMNQRRARLSRREFRGLAGHAAQFFLLAIGPLMILVLGASTGLYDAEEAVDLMLDLGLVFLVVVGGLAGRRSGGSWWFVLLCAVIAGLLGLLVLLLRVVLEH